MILRIFLVRHLPSENLSVSASLLNIFNCHIVRGQPRPRVSGSVHPYLYPIWLLNLTMVRRSFILHVDNVFSNFVSAFSFAVNYGKKHQWLVIRKYFLANLDRSMKLSSLSCWLTYNILDMRNSYNTELNNEAVVGSQDVSISPGDDYQYQRKSEWYFIEVVRIHYKKCNYRRKNRLKTRYVHQWINID